MGNKGGKGAKEGKDKADKADKGSDKAAPAAASGSEYLFKLLLIGDSGVGKSALPSLAPPSLPALPRPCSAFHPAFFHFRA